jgi:hypothetical protein
MATCVLLTGVITQLGPHTYVHRATFYCMLDYRPLVIISGAISAAFLFGTVIFQTWTVAIVYRRFVGSRRIGATEIGDMEAATFFRVLAFSLYVFVSLM